MSRIRNFGFIVLTIVLIGVAFKFYFTPLIGTTEGESNAADLDIPVVARIKGGMLEVASVSGTKHFSEQVSPTVLGKAIPFCKETSGINAAYKITYRLKLMDKWPMRYSDGQLIARVPDLVPSLPVAIDTASLAKTGTDGCWFMLDLGTQNKVLKRISRNLRNRAIDPRTKLFAREEARKTVAEFLRTWTFNQKDYPDLAPDAPIKILFPGE